MCSELLEEESAGRKGHLGSEGPGTAALCKSPCMFEFLFMWVIEVGKGIQYIKNKQTTRGLSRGCLGVGREQIWELLLCILEILFWSEFWVPSFTPLLSPPSPTAGESLLFLPSPPKNAGCPQLGRDHEYLASISRCPRGLSVGCWVKMKLKTSSLTRCLRLCLLWTPPHQPTQLNTL